MSPTRVWLGAGLAHVSIGGALGLATAAPLRGIDASAHVMFLTTGLLFAAGALAFGILPAFIQRDATFRWSQWAPVAALVLGDFVWAAREATGGPAVTPLAAFHGAAIALALLHAPMVALKGRRWPEAIDLFAEGATHRRGDIVSAAAIGLGAVSAGAAAVLFVAAPRGLVTAGVVVAIAGGVMPFLLGVLTFALPRVTARPVDGITLLGVALGLHALAVGALGYAFVRPAGAPFLYPAATMGAAYLLAAIALRRAPLDDDHPARPLLRGAAALGVLTLLLLGFAFAPDVPTELLPLLLYAHAAFATTLLAAAVIISARLVQLGAPRAGVWRKGAVAGAIAGLFLLAPAFQFPRAFFPGALVLALSLAFAVRGLWPAVTGERVKGRGSRGRRTLRQA